jgi:hypothetical protein
VGSATTVVRHDIPSIQLREWVQGPAALGLVLASVYFGNVGIQALIHPVPVALSVRPDGAQLRIAWNSKANAKGAMLDIIDGGQHAAIFVPPRLASVTYQARTVDVEVRFASAGGNSPLEIARCLVPEPESVGRLDHEMAATQASAGALRIEIRRRTERVDRLLQAAGRLLATVPEKPRTKLVEVKPKTSAWWR